MMYEYVTRVMGVKGYRISGDDHSEKLASLLDEVSSELGKDGWELVNVFPSLMSGGAAAKLLAVYKRQIKEKTECPDH